MGSVISGLAVWSLVRTTSALPTRFAVVPPAGGQLSDPVVSPDGRTIAFVEGIGGGTRVYLRGLGQREAVPMEGTEAAPGLFGMIPESFSPDGRWLLLTDRGPFPPMLNRIPVAGGPAVPIGETSNQGATWGPDDTIVLGSNEGLWSMPVSGGGGSH